jgi:hypothetical protein
LRDTRTPYQANCIRQLSANTANQRRHHAASTHDHVLFLGDSITDCGRGAAQNNNDGWGTGYAAMCAARLSAQHPNGICAFPIAASAATAFMTWKRAWNRRAGAATDAGFGSHRHQRYLAALRQRHNFAHRGVRRELPAHFAERR